MFYAAIPGNNATDFNTSNRCGACVQIGSTIVTILDECASAGTPACQNNPTGHLVLSASAASAAGVAGNPSLTWKFVPCPVTGNVKVRISGDMDLLFVENEVLPIASVTCAGKTGTRQSNGAWYFTVTTLAGNSCTVTDIDGRSISVALGSESGVDVDTGKQFPSSCASG